MPINISSLLRNIIEQGKGEPITNIRDLIINTGTIIEVKSVEKINKYIQKSFNDNGKKKTTINITEILRKEMEKK
jgi:hypothetical protein